MNVLIVNKYHFITGGPERYMFNFMELMKSHDITAIPLCLDVKNNIPTEYSENFLPAPYPNSESHYSNARVSKYAKARLFLRSIFYATGALRTYQLVKKHSIDIAYLLNICNYISPSVIIGAKLAGARVVMRMSDYNITCANYTHLRDGTVCTKCKTNRLSCVLNRCVRDSFQLSLGRFVSMAIHDYTYIYSLVDAFVTPSNYMKNSLMLHGIHRDKVHYVPSFSLGTVKSNENDGKYVLYFGRFAPEKGLDTLLYAAKNVINKDIPLIIIGDGPSREKLITMKEEHHLDNVTILPFMEKAKLHKYINDCKFSVVPSLWHDNSPMSVYESFAFGKPVIGSNVGGLIDQVESDAGLLVPAGDPFSLGNAINTLWNDTSLYASACTAAWTKITGKFSPESHASAMLALFHKVCQNQFVPT